MASYDFGESQTLAQLYGQALRRAGFRVEVIDRIGNREVVMPAVVQGRVDVVVDYVGSSLAFLDPAHPVMYPSTEASVAALQARLSPRGISALNPAAAQDQNGFAMTNVTAKALGVSRLSQLKKAAPTLKFGGPPECTSRPFCLPGLQRVYGLTFASFTPMESRYATAAALASKEIDVGMLETTDARLAPGQFTLLDDDLKLQPRENIVPLVRTRLLDGGGGRLATALNEVSALLTTDRLIALNKAVEIDGRNASEVTAEWL
ncbi:MAG: ABC transporter substrate-binding protein, partial [Actinomycetota bacterium]|nr:ABC transporter substrate-binding protein [Actinomycetota bacterium]